MIRSLHSDSASDSEIEEYNSDINKSIESSDEAIETSEDEEDEFDSEIKLKRADTESKLSQAWDKIFEKYGDPKLELETDIIDLNTGEIIEDHGHLEEMEEDSGSLWTEDNMNSISSWKKDEIRRIKRSGEEDGVEIVSDEDEIAIAPGSIRKDGYLNESNVIYKKGLTSNKSNSNKNSNKNQTPKNSSPFKILKLTPTTTPKRTRKNDPSNSITSYLFNSESSDDDELIPRSPYNSPTRTINSSPERQLIYSSPIKNNKYLSKPPVNSSKSSPLIDFSALADRCTATAERKCSRPFCFNCN